MSEKGKKTQKTTKGTIKQRRGEMEKIEFIREWSFEQVLRKDSERSVNDLLEDARKLVDFVTENTSKPNAQ